MKISVCRATEDTQVAIGEDSRLAYSEGYQYLGSGRSVVLID